MSFIIIIALYFIVSFILKRSLDYFRDNALLDIPSKRSNHSTPIPKGAGLILIPLLIFATLLVFFLEKILNYHWFIIFGFCLILTLLSFLDDLKNISSKIRLTFQIFCVFSTLIIFKEDIGLFIEVEEINFFFENEEKDSLTLLFLIIFGFFWVWIVNMFNFMDGMDGITVVQVSSLALCSNILAITGFIDQNFLYFSLVILATFIAFYSVNRPPAKIFLGDVGSIPIGFLSGFVVIYNIIHSQIIFPFLIIIMYYLVDSISTISIRLFKGENIFRAHSDHFYQKVIRKGYSHSYVLNKILGLNFLLLFLSIASIYWPLISTVLAFLFTTILLGIFNFKKSK